MALLIRMFCMISTRNFLLARISAYFCFIDASLSGFWKKQHNALDVVAVLIFFPNVIFNSERPSGVKNLVTESLKLRVVHNPRPENCAPETSRISGCCKSLGYQPVATVTFCSNKSPSSSVKILISRR